MQEYRYSSHGPRQAPVVHCLKGRGLLYSVLRSEEERVSCNNHELDKTEVRQRQLPASNFRQFGDCVGLPGHQIGMATGRVCRILKRDVSYNAFSSKPRDAVVSAMSTWWTGKFCFVACKRHQGRLRSRMPSVQDYPTIHKGSKPGPYFLASCLGKQ